MKKILKAFVAWLDRKFPDKVVITLADYEKLKGQTDERFRKIESEIIKFNVALGFGGVAEKLKSMPFQR